MEKEKGSEPNVCVDSQVDDSGHVQIHLEEEPDSSASVCNGQSLLDQLEACEVSSTTDAVPGKAAVKRPMPDEADETESPAAKKALVQTTTNAEATSEPLEATASKSVNGTPSTSATASNSTMTTTVATNGTALVTTNSVIDTASVYRGSITLENKFLSSIQFKFGSLSVILFSFFHTVLEFESPDSSSSGKLRLELTCECVCVFGCGCRR